MKRLNNAAELDEEAVTRGLDEPAIACGDRWIKQLAFIALKAWRVARSSAPIRRE